MRTVSVQIDPLPLPASSPGQGMGVALPAIRAAAAERLALDFTPIVIPSMAMTYNGSDFPSVLFTSNCSPTLCSYFFNGFNSLTVYGKKRGIDIGHVQIDRYR